MRPLKLKLCAFGPFAGAQEIDFAKLGKSGLYLVAGETGAGKTTIFDAISYALYGKASGAARDKPAMLRSDFAEPGARTFVELEFAAGAGVYRIRRAIKVSAKDAARAPVKEAELRLPDGRAVSGEREATAKIEEALGLDYSQFGQIVMIAQNDFLRFLHSKTETRVEILRKIFGTERCLGLQKALKDLAKDAKDAAAFLQKDFERLGVDPGASAEASAAWESQLETDRRLLGETDGQLAALDARRRGLAAALAVAEELGGKFRELDGLRGAKRLHDEKEGEAGRAKERLAQGERALKLKPLEDGLRRETANSESAAAALRQASEDKEAACAELDAAEKSLLALPGLDGAREAHAALSRDCDEALRRAKQLAELDAARTEIAKKKAGRDAKKAELDAALALLAELPPPGGAEEALEKLAGEKRRCEERFAALDALQKEWHAALGKKAGQKQAQEKLEKLEARFMAAAQERGRLEAAFMGSQAAALAAKLEQGKPCPVCGSAEHPRAARLPEGGASEAELAEAAEAMERARAERDRMSAEHGALKAEAKTLGDRLFDDLAKWIPEITRDLAAKAVLAENLAASRLLLDETEAKHKKAAETLAETKKALEGANRRRETLAPLAASLGAELDTLSRRYMADLGALLPGVSRETADAELARSLDAAKKRSRALLDEAGASKAALEKLAAGTETAERRLSAALARAASAQALAAERSGLSKKAAALLDEARQKFAQAVSQSGFAGEREYRGALLPEAELALIGKRLAEREKAGEQLARDICRLERETAGKERPETAGLQSEAEAAGFEAAELSQKRDEIRGRLGRTETALEELTALSAEYGAAEKKYATVRQLSDAANGKQDFETYAQAAHFDRVLAQANKRLGKLSQGRYSLQRRTEIVNRRQRAGLDIDIMDSYTGKARLAGSLSGGESFMASLALALGLSDAVQRSAGGIALDAMFIDEGFGTLDMDALEQAVRTLSELAGENRTVGIISHVTELQARIEKQIQVDKTPRGSRARVLA